jgi:hypothetical protein
MMAEQEPRSYGVHPTLGFEVPRWVEDHAYQFAWHNKVPFEDAFWELVMVGHIDLDNMWQIHAALIEKQFATVH